MTTKLKCPVDGVQKVKVRAVPEIVGGSYRGCCFLSYPGDFHVVGVYGAAGGPRCNASGEMKCDVDNVIFVADTDEGRAAYITTKLLSS